MSVPYYGDFAEDDTVLIPFNTFSSDDPSASVTVTTLANADIKVHKDGGLTEIATDGATVSINFDSRTGAHLITVDTSAHADYSTGSEYAVMIEGATVDGGNITAWVGAFSIERAGGTLALLKNATYGLDKLVRATTPANTLDVEAGGCAGVDWGNVANPTTANDLSGTDIQLVDTCTTNTDMVAEAPAASAIADAVWDEDIVAAHNTVDTAGALLDDLGTPANFMADVSGLATTTELNKVPKSDGTTSWNATALAAINAEADTALSDYGPNTVVPDAAGVAATPAEVATALTDIHLDHLLAANYDPASKPGVATALLNELVENDVGVSRFTANALEEAPTGGSAPTVGEIADAVWDEDIVAAHNTADTAGALLDDLGTPSNFMADVSGLATTTELNKVPKSDGTSSWNSTALAAIQGEANDALVALNLDHLCAQATGLADMTSEVVDNSILSRIISNGDTSAFVPSTDGLQPIRDHIGDGTNLTEAGGTGDQLTAINLPNQTMDITGNLSGSVGSVTGAVGSVTGHTVQTGDTFALANGATGFVAIDTVVDSILAQLSEVDNDGTAISHAGAMKLILSVLTGESGGGGTSTLTFRDIADTKSRISATVDSNGNRTAVGTRDAS